MKNALKPEQQALCLSSTEIPLSIYLCGECIGKQIKEVEETNKITKAFKQIPDKMRSSGFNHIFRAYFLSLDSVSPLGVIFYGKALITKQ